MTARIWVVHPVKDDLSSAEVWGTIRFITARYVYGDELRDDGAMPLGFRTELEQAARQFNPHHDFLLIVGDHLQLIHIAALLAQRYGNFNVLRWDRQAAGYLKARVGLPLVTA